MTDTVATPQAVLAFWREAGPDKWFNKDDAFDNAIREKFLTTYEAAAAGQLVTWEAQPESALALLIVLDQFPRNMFRGSGRTFAADPLALAIAGRAIANGFVTKIPAGERQFVYLPFEHSEKFADQELSIALMAATGDTELLKWAELHADIIRRFGRFPHRNVMLGRTTTAEEQTFLDGGGFKG